MKRLPLISKIIFYPIIIFLSYSACLTTNQTDKDELFFEGEVQYKVEYESMDQRLSKQFLINSYGDTLIGKVKEDKYIMYQNTKVPNGKTKMIYLLNEGIIYIEQSNSDTIYKMRLDEKEGPLIEFKRNKEDKLVILGDECESISIKFTPKKKNAFYKLIEAKYYFNTDYKLNPQKYTNHFTSYWNLFVNEAKSISVRNEIINHPYYKVVYEAFKITPMKISDDEFLIDKNKPIKEI